MKPRNYILIAIIRWILGLFIVSVSLQSVDAEKYVKAPEDTYTVPNYISKLGYATRFFLLIYVTMIAWHIHGKNEKERLTPQYDPSRPTTHRPP